MLSVSHDLLTAYYLKEYLYDILTAKTQELAKEMFLEWIEYAADTGIPEFKAAITAYKNWLPQIVNSCCQPITNGFIKGCTIKLKFLKEMPMVTDDLTVFEKEYSLCSLMSLN